MKNQNKFLVNIIKKLNNEQIHVLDVIIKYIFESSNWYMLGVIIRYIKIQFIPQQLVILSLLKSKY